MLSGQVISDWGHWPRESHISRGEMTKITGKLGIVGLTILLFMISSNFACDSSNTLPTEPVTIAIGNLTDLTGVSANGMEPINMALGDMVRYYNENNLIPGVELEVETYDGQYNPSNDISGYEWLLERGADIIFTPVPPTPASLRTRVNEDKV